MWKICWVLTLFGAAIPANASDNQDNNSFFSCFSKKQGVTVEPPKVPSSASSDEQLYYEIDPYNLPKPHVNPISWGKRVANCFVGLLRFCKCVAPPIKYERSNNIIMTVALDDLEEEDIKREAKWQRDDAEANRMIELAVPSNAPYHKFVPGSMPTSDR